MRYRSKMRTKARGGAHLKGKSEENEGCRIGLRLEMGQKRQVTGSGILRERWRWRIIDRHLRERGRGFDEERTGEGCSHE
jgi:hypothetical protein